uniref:PAS domain-containing protein n=1 Tax=Panagrolaimus sp. JU765 TaxID=591449 RepID=A0AC34QEA3_9BILA
MVPNAEESSLETSKSPNRQNLFLKTKKTRLQHYIRKLKKVLSEHESLASSSDSAAAKHLTTFQALEKAIVLIREDSRRLSSWSGREPNVMTASDTRQSQESTSDVSSPPSPAATATSTTSTENAEKQPIPSDSRQVPDRCWGIVQLSLPDGLIQNSWPSPVQQPGLPKFDNVLRRNGTLLDILQGKGAQTLLLNAFCGIPKRRMYARLRCGQQTRPFELLCEFTPNSRNPSTCLADIQILCLESGAASSGPVAFTTRHNASCALIYLDAASIPYLGHFPSEISGKSLFTFIHADDVPLIQRAHKQLHETNGKLVSTPKLRLVSYNGTVIQVDSEWSAFVNPWTKTIEMIVGRHCIQPMTIDVDPLAEPVKDRYQVAIPVERYRELDSSIHALISRPIVEVKENQQSLRNFIDNVVETLVEKQQISEEVRTLQESPPVLSYNQINCLENVHRLLKSQSKFLELAGEKESKENEQMNEECLSVPSVPLTQEILQQHNRKWEAECKDTWKKRLASKRIAISTDESVPKQKVARIRSEPQPYSISTAPLPPRPNKAPIPPLPVPAPTPLDQAAWSEYVRIVQLHLQNMASADHNQSNKMIHQIAQRAQNERQLAALALTFQQVQIPPSASTSPFNPLPSLEH